MSVSFIEGAMKSYTRDPKEGRIVINGKEFEAIIRGCSRVSKILADGFSSNNRLEFTDDSIDINSVSEEVSQILTCKPISITAKNVDQLKKVSSILGMDYLTFVLNDVILDEDIITEYFEKNPAFEAYIQVQNSIQTISDDSKIDEAVLNTLKCLDQLDDASFISSFIRCCNNCPKITVLQMVKYLCAVNDSHNTLLPSLLEFFRHKIDYSQYYIAQFILHVLLDQGKITKEQVRPIIEPLSPCFLFFDYFGVEDIDYYKSLKDDEKQKLLAQDFSDHKRAICEGHSMEPVLVAIRHDNFTELQNLLNQVGASQDLTYQDSEYERSRVVKAECHTLIDYAAYFSSVECFNFLISKQSSYDKNSYLIPAIIGGCLDIITQIQNEVTFEKEHATIALTYHQEEIFNNLLENDYIEYNESLIFDALKHENYNVFLDLIKKGFQFIDYFFANIKNTNIALFKDSINLLQKLGKQSYINLARKYNILFFI